MIFNLILAYALHAHDLDCGANLKHLSANRPVYGVSNGKFVELERVERQIKKVSVIVPVYRELANGNLPRLMRTLSAQTLDAKILQVVLVVNNSRTSAERADSVYAENQATLAWLNKNHFGFDLKVIDLSTQGIEPNMGYVRQVGAEGALGQVPRDQQVLVFMDADTEFPPDHLARLRQAYQNFAVDAVVSRLQFEVRDPSNLKSFLSHPAYHSFMRYSMLRRALRYAQRGAGTPQISALAEGFLAVGGFPRVSSGEDLELMQRLAKLKTYFAPDLTVTTEDRAREDGFDAAYRLNWNQSFSWTKTVEREEREIFVDLLHPLKDRQSELIAKKRVSPYTAVLHLHKELGEAVGFELPGAIHPEFFAHHESQNHPGYDADAMSAIFDYFYEHTTERPGPLSAFVVHALAKLSAFEFTDEVKNRRLAHEKAVAARQDFLRVWFGGQTPTCNSSDVFIRFFCAPSSALRQLFVELKREFAGEADALEQVTQLFPEYLGGWREASFTTDRILLEITEGLVLTGFHDPDQIQGLQKLLR